MIVRLSWGYRVPLKVTVVSLSVRGSTSIFRYQHQTYLNASGRPTFTKKKSPPLGIPLMLMEETQEEYARYIKRIVQHDLDEYARIAYEPEESDIAKRLLKTVCRFYIAGVESNDEVRHFSFRQCISCCRFVRSWVYCLDLAPLELIFVKFDTPNVYCDCPDS